jgi:myosin-18
MQNLAASSRTAGVGHRRDREFVGGGGGGSSVKDKVSRYEQAAEGEKGVSASYTSLNSRDRSVTSPPPSTSAGASQHGSNASLLRPDVRSQAGSSYSSVASPASDQITVNTTTNTSGTSPYRRPGFESPPGPAAAEDSRTVKPYDGRDLPLPPLQMATVRHRSVVAEKSPANGGGFGFVLRQSYLPMPDDPGQTRLVHLVEPRPDYMGPLMTGDRITQVNGEDVEDKPHERVVELIKASGDRVELMVASMPELLELNARVFHGSDNPFVDRGNKMRKSSRMKPGQTGTLRKQAAKAKKEFRARSEEEVLSDKQGLENERVWVVHRAGFSLGTVRPEDTSAPSNFSSHFSIIRYQGKDTKKVKLAQTDDIIDVDEEDLEKANPPHQDTVEDLVDLTHLNEPSVLHVLRQRYGSSLIHTFAGRHLIVMNPLRPLSCYVDRVVDMFRGCRREDMPPHIFAAGQQAYRNMMTTRSDQSLILMGLSGSGKTFNARYLLRYLATIGQTENATVTNAKLDAVELLLHSFGSAATFLNPQATRCICLYTLDFDPSGSVTSAQVRTYLLEKTRVASHPEGEGNFNIFYQLIAGADDQLTAELMLDALPGEEPNLYVEPHDNEQRVESAAYVWDLIQNCLDILGISESEAMGLWSLLAAIYHLGYAGVKKSAVRGSECFLNPAAAQRAAIILGIDHEDLGKDIFNPPRGASFRLPSLFSSPSQSSNLNLTDTGSIHSYGSPIIAAQSGNRSAALDAFAMGLYEQAVSALVMLINRALQGPSSAKSRSSIHVLDTPGFQHRELAGARNGASFDELCMNYTQERLHMLFHDVTFTLEQDRYIQENINWMFSESPESPLPLINAIDKHVGRRGMAVDVNTDRRGLLWILEEESMFPGASDSSFLDRVHMYHGKPGEMGDPPLIKVMKEENQFQIRHCQHSLPVLYDANGWVKRAREHPSFRIVAQVMADSKKECIGSIFQGRGVAASATNISTSALKVDAAHSSLSRTRSGQATNYASPGSGIKKSSICLQTKFQLDSLIDVMRKTRQWFIRCILPQIPSKLPGALPSPDPILQKSQSELAPHGVVNVPLIKAQIQRADIVKAARIYKQGFPEHMSFPEFCRRYGTIEKLDVPLNTPEAVQEILMLQEVPSHAYKLGISQVFLRSGILPKLDQRVEAHTHSSMVLFQARCRGYLGRKRFRELEVLDSAAYVIQSNVAVWMEIRDWSWWQLYTKIKPLLAIWRVERQTKEKQAEIDKLLTKVAKLEDERDTLQESENLLSEKVKQLTLQMTASQEAASQAEELLENEQIEKREMEEQLSDLTGKVDELGREKEQLNLQIAEVSILARIKQEEGDAELSPQGGYMDKYWETKRELETLRQRLSTERDDELETLHASKRSLEKKLADSEAEVEELNRSLTQLRKKTVKQGQELNDLKLHLESQQARNEELEKRQRKFDSELSSAKEGAVQERQEKEKLAQGRHNLRSDLDELSAKLKETQEELEKANHEREDLQTELLQQTSAASTESEVTSLKRMKRELETKLEGMEDDLDEANIKVDNLQQGKARLEVANQTLKAQHQKELESRDEEVEAMKGNMNKKLKALGDQIEELHEEKQAATKVGRQFI